MRRQILDSIAHKHRDGWHVVGLDINYEDNGLCEGSLKAITSKK
jgi:hypothetical protein